MKKIGKVCLSLSTLAVVGVLYTKYLHDQKESVIQKSLDNARMHVSDMEITGSWIDTTYQMDSLTREKVFVGAIMTENGQYDFISSAKTGDILYFEKEGAGA